MQLPVTVSVLQCQEVDVSIQPASAASETVWALGVVRLIDAVAKPSRLHLLEPKPSISHLFRVPDKRPLEALSYLFAAVATLPLAGLLIGLYHCNVNVKVCRKATHTRHSAEVEALAGFVIGL